MISINHELKLERFHSLNTREIFETKKKNTRDKHTSSFIMEVKVFYTGKENGIFFAENIFILAH